MLTLLLLAGLFGLPARAAASPGAILAADPASLDLPPGEQRQVAITLNDVQDLYGLELHLRFDPQVVQVVDQDQAADGVQAGLGNLLSQPFVAVNRADNAAGTYDFAATLVNPAPPASGSGIVVRLVIEGKAAGESPLAFTSAILANREAAEIPASRQDGSIRVGGAAAQGAAAPVQESAPAASSDAADPETAPLTPAGPDVTILGIAGVGLLAFLAALIFFFAALRRRMHA
jgi:hypothetical protein